MAKRIFAAMLVVVGLMLSLASPALASGGGGGGGEGRGGSVAPSGFIGGGAGASRAIIEQTMQAVTSSNQLAAQATTLEQAARAYGNTGDERSRKTLVNLLEQINKQADQIEAQIAEIEPKYDSPLLKEKMGRLKQYVSSIRAEADRRAQEVL